MIQAYCILIASLLCTKTIDAVKNLIFSDKNEKLSSDINSNLLEDERRGAKMTIVFAAARDITLSEEQYCDLNTSNEVDIDTGEELHLESLASTCRGPPGAHIFSWCARFKHFND